MGTASNKNAVFDAGHNSPESIPPTGTFKLGTKCCAQKKGNTCTPRSMAVNKYLNITCC